MYAKPSIFPFVLAGIYISKIEELCFKVSMGSQRRLQMGVLLTLIFIQKGVKKSMDVIRYKSAYVGDDADMVLLTFLHDGQLSDGFQKKKIASDSNISCVGGEAPVFTNTSIIVHVSF